MKQGKNTTKTRRGYVTRAEFNCTVNELQQQIQSLKQLKITIDPKRVSEKVNQMFENVRNIPQLV